MSAILPAVSSVWPATKLDYRQITGPDILRPSAFGDKTANEAIGHISGANKTNCSTFQNFSLAGFQMLLLLRKWL